MDLEHDKSLVLVLVAAALVRRHSLDGSTFVSREEIQQMIDDPRAGTLVLGYQPDGVRVDVAPLPKKPSTLAPSTETKQ